MVPECEEPTPLQFYLQMLNNIGQNLMKSV